MQESLDFGRAERVEHVYRRLLRSLDDAVTAVGLAVAAGACNVRKTDLADALRERDGRYVRIEWLVAILDVAPPDFRRRIIDALVAWQGLTVVTAKPLTTAEQLARLKERVADRFGAAGKELLQEDL